MLFPLTQEKNQRIKIISYNLESYKLAQSTDLNKKRSYTHNHFFDVSSLKNGYNQKTLSIFIVVSLNKN